MVSTVVYASSSLSLSFTSVTVEGPCSHSTAMISASRLLSDTLISLPPLV